MIFAFFVCVVISASNMSAAAPFFNRPIFSLLGKLSMSVYLCHQTVAYIIGYVTTADGSPHKLLIENNPGVRPFYLIIYVLNSVLLGIICLAVCSAISKRIKKRREKKTIDKT